MDNKMVFFIIAVIIIIIIYVNIKKKKKDTSSIQNNKSIASKNDSEDEAIKRHKNAIEKRILKENNKHNDDISKKPVFDGWIKLNNPILINGFKLDGVFIDNNVNDQTSINLNFDISIQHYELTKKYDLGYYPEYSELEPEQKGVYLKWITDGRQDININIGYVFIFYYGLERRLLIDNNNLQFEEVKEIYQEIKRLKSIYDNNSFQNYTSNLLEYIACIHNISDKEYLALEYNKSLSRPGSYLLKSIGESFNANGYIDKNLILFLIVSDNFFPKRVIFHDFPHYLLNLIDCYLEEKYNSQIPVFKKSELIIDYKFASNYNHISYTFNNVIDITKDRQLYSILLDIYEKAESELKQYSRVVKSSKESLVVLRELSYLPKLVFDVLAQQNENVKHLKNQLASLVNNTDVYISNEKLFKTFIATEIETLPKKDASELNQLLNLFGIGIIPDVRYDNETMKATNHSLLYQYDGTFSSSLSDAYFHIQALIYFTITVAKADNVVTDEEKKFLFNIIELNELLNEYEKMRLKKYISFLTQEETDINRLRRHIKNLSEEEQQLLIKYMIDMAAVDGEISDTEINALEKIFKMLGIDLQILYSEIHRQNLSESDDLVDVLPAQDEKVYSIPREHTEEHEFQLNTAKIQRTEEETQKLQKVLATIFNEDSETISEEKIVEFTDTDANDKYRYFPDKLSIAIDTIIENPQIEYFDFRDKMKDAGLLAEGVVDQINDIAIEHYGSELIDTFDDEFEIDVEILNEIKK